MPPHGPLKLEIVLNDVQSLLQSHGPLLVFLNVLLKQSGLPIPTYPLLLAAGALAAHGSMSYGVALACAVAGATIADTGWYLAGRRFGGSLLRIVCRISLSRDTCIRDTQSMYRRYGPPYLLVCKFVPGTGGLTIIMAGLTGVPLRRFWPYNIAGNALWAGSALLLGGVFHDLLNRVIDLLGRYGIYGVMVVLLALLVYLCVRMWRRHRVIRNLRHIPRATLDDLDAWRAEGRAPVLVDVRVGATDPMPGAVLIDPHAPLAAIKLGDIDELADGGADATLALERDIVVYCSCPGEVSAAIFADKLRRAGYTRVWALTGGHDAWLQRQEKTTQRAA
jgi:membrane protein DedA with SNARE-associated domain/rhodanese-related sulfurtransferase